MKAFFSQLMIQFKGDLRDRGVFMVYYLVPLVFYLVMGSIMKVIEMDSGTSLILSISIFALSMSSYLGMPQSLVKARENGVLEAYRVAGIPSWSLPVATILISLLHIMMVACIILFTAPFLFGVDLPQHIPLHLISVFIIAVCSSAFGALIACLVKKQTTLTLVGQLLFLPTVMLSGIMFPASLLPKVMQSIGSLLPASQGLSLIAGDSLRTEPLLMLTGMTLIVFVMSAVLFRRISMRI